MTLTPVMSRDRNMAVYRGRPYVFLAGEAWYCCWQCSWRRVCPGFDTLCEPSARPDRRNGYWAKAPERT